jgi:hypothetical protein
MRIQLSTLEPFAPIVVNIRGRVAYSHIRNKIEGQELADVNQRKLMHGGIAESTPYYSLNIRDARVIPDANTPQPVLDYFADAIRSKKFQDGTESLFYYGKDKSNTPIPVAYSAEAGNLAGQGITEKGKPIAKELATGLDITIGVKVYKINKGAAKGRVGLGIDYVLVNEPVRYYENVSGIEAALAAQGVSYTPAPANEAAVGATQEAVQSAPVNTGVADTTPQAVSPMVTTQAVSPVPMQAAPQAQQAAASPMFQQNQFPQGGANYQPQQAPVQNGYVQTPVQAAPVQQAVPQNAAPVQNAMPGLSYNPN